MKEVRRVKLDYAEIEPHINERVARLLTAYGGPCARILRQIHTAVCEDMTYREAGIPITAGDVEAICAEACAAAIGCDRRQIETMNLCCESIVSGEAVFDVTYTVDLAEPDGCDTAGD